MTCITGVLFPAGDYHVWGTFLLMSRAVSSGSKRLVQEADQPSQGDERLELYRQARLHGAVTNLTRDTFNINFKQTGKVTILTCKSKVLDRSLGLHCH